MRCLPLVFFGAAAVANLALTCSSAITAPREAQILPDPAIRATATILRKFDPASVIVAIDGVDLTAAVGLVPPFADESAVVVVGGASVTVSDFDFVVGPTMPHLVSLELAGLPAGSHQLQVTATPTAGGAPTVLVRNFVRVAGFAEAARERPDGALAGRIAIPGGGSHRVASIGGDPAGPPVPSADGGTLRPGFAAVSEQLRSEGTP